MEKIILRKARTEDLDSMWNNIWQDKEFAKFMLWKPVENIEKAKIRLQKNYWISKNKSCILYLPWRDWWSCWFSWSCRYRWRSFWRLRTLYCSKISEKWLRKAGITITIKNDFWRTRWKRVYLQLLWRKHGISKALRISWIRI